MSQFYDQASLVMIPSGYKNGKVYSQKPLSTDGELTFSRASTATRVNASGLIEEVASGLPRLDYSGGCPSLLLEPQRTNLVTYSEQFDNAAWTKIESSISANAAVSPDGYSSADKFIPNTSNVIHALANTITSVSASWTYSIFAKAAGYDRVIINTYNTNYVGFNLTSGVIESSLGTGITSANIENYGNGWYRCSITSTTTASGANVAVSIFNAAYTNGNTNPTFAGNGTDGVLLWGAQLEAGAYATSYIPTLSTAVTRVADTAQKTGISSLIGQTEGTLFIELDIIAGSPVYHTLMQVFGDAGNRIGIGQDLNSTNVFMYINASGTASYQIATTPAGHYKIALAYKSGDSVLYINGTPAITNSRTVTIATPLTTLFLNNVNGGEIGTFKDSQSILFKTRLSNSDLATLTSL